MNDDDERSELEIAWSNFKNTLKQEQPFKFIYDVMIKILDWMTSKLNK